MIGYIPGWPFPSGNDNQKQTLRLAEGLSKVDGVSIAPESLRTNMVFAKLDTDMTELCGFINKQEILIDNANPLRLLTHLDISEQDIDRTIQAFDDFFNGSR